ncbi:hypothetical protein Raf01_70530 [Rugosimonospora africana]|uniref:Uncharacterized protein n=1 Tax=Rugosimonospora africana TaxID=556532 RepID=A0A8J3VUM3_9ACTN|nr:hypothetical protein Raf01_70530 [Rugosimonospora africana]
MRTRRDLGVTALVEGFFAAAWFGWGQQAQVAGLEVWLDIGSVVALLVAVGGAVIGLRSPASTAVLHDRSAGRRYGITVGIEFGVAGVGAWVLGAAGQAEFIPVWVCAIVGLHFFALAPILRDRTLVPLGVLTCAVAVAALVVGLATGLDASTVTGVGTGCCLLAFGGYALARAVSSRPDRATP